MAKFELTNKKRNYLWASIFHIPSIIFFIIFLLTPILFNFYLSFFKWDIVRPMEFRGFENFIRFFVTDPKTVQVTLNTVYFTLMVMPLSILFPLMIAVLMQKIKVGRNFFQSIYFLPLVTSPTAIALVWRYIYSKQHGIITAVLSPFLDEKINWLGDPRFALLCISIILIWLTIPINTILLIAAVRNIPSELFESARIDGAREMGLFKFVTVPMISPTLFFVLILTTVSTFLGGFDLIKILTQGGPLGSTTVYIYHLYHQAFNTQRFGYASAISLIFFIFILGFTYTQFRLQRRWVHY